MTADKRRAQILDAVEPIVLEHGQLVTSKQLAQAAGVAEGTLFKVFGSKEALLRALITRFHSRPDEVGVWLESGGAEGLTLEELVEGMTVRGITRWTSATRLYQVLASLVEYPDTEALTAWISAIEQPWANALAEHREALTIAPDRAAGVLRTLLWAASTQEDWGLGITASEAARVFLHGVQVPGDEPRRT